MQLALPILLLLALATLGCAKQAPFINAWLVCGTFDNDAENSGYDRDWIDEAAAAPAEGMRSGGKVWRYFDDRLFSRNYDDYQDLFSYFKIKRGESIAAKVAYTHVYAYSLSEQAGELRVGADNEFKAWLNGEPVAASTQGCPHRDMIRGEVTLRPGWNRLLVKVANQESGRFGFYARLCATDGAPLPGLTLSPDGPGDVLSIGTRAMPDATTGDLPAAFQGWPFVAANAEDVLGTEWQGSQNAGLFWKSPLAMHASEFALQASGGAPPYRWALASADLPEGLKLTQEGCIVGVVDEDARLGDYPLQVRVQDAKGAGATKGLTLNVKPRPNRWYEQARLTALIHGPERTPDGEHQKLADLMKRQGYGCGMAISFNNGLGKCRWPSIYEPHLEDHISPIKEALVQAQIRFGMYMGNLICPNNGGDNGGILLVEDAMRKFNPEALWFDWASTNVDGYPSLDALYSMIRTINPDTLIVLNGVQTMYQGDWDVLCLEGWGAWGDNHWNLWPFEIPWPKKACLETWRLVTDPEFDYSKGIHPDWAEYLRLQISVIGEGFVANIDHSPTIRQAITTLDESVVIQAHQKMADWANPPGCPPLHESYTQVDPAPLPAESWGYATVNIPRDTIYLHMLQNPYGKTGMPDADSLTLASFMAPVKSVTWMNQNQAVAFEQDGETLALSLQDIDPDPVDTILKISLGNPYPDVRVPRARKNPVPPGNLAGYKPARLLSRDGSHPLPASGFSFAPYGVDGAMHSKAQGANEWAWSYQVDLQEVFRVRRIVIHFGTGCYATEYKVHVSQDGAAWQQVAYVTDATGGTREHVFEATEARHVRIEAIKPDGPGQPGAQMSIAELEVYEWAPSR